MFLSQFKRKIYLNKIMLAHLISKFKISLFALFLSKIQFIGNVYWI